MDELKAPALKRPMDRTAMSNDMGILKNLLGMLNNTALTGAELPTDTPAVVQKPEPPPTPESPPTAFRLPKNCRRLFLTGAGKSGKNWLSAQVGAHWVELHDPITMMGLDIFGSDARPESLDPFLREVFAFGEGIVSQKYPLTAARALFVEWTRSRMTEIFGVSPKNFGTDGFWISSVIARTDAFLREFPRELAVVTNVETSDQYKALKAAGFANVHVICNNVTRSGRGGTALVDPLVSHIERGITEEISQRPRGPKLRAVWCDPSYAPTSNRLLTVQEFIAGVSL